MKYSDSLMNVMRQLHQRQYRTLLWAAAGWAFGASAGVALGLPARQTMFAAVLCAGVLAIVRLNVRVQPGTARQELLPQPQPVRRLSAPAAQRVLPPQEPSLLDDADTVAEPDQARELLAKFLEEHQQ